MTTTQDLAKKLYKLAQLDIDAVNAYEQALKNIEHAGIHTQISTFRDDHVRHINELSVVIRTLGSEPPERTLDIKGVLIAGFTVIRSAMGTEGALKAMQGNEKLTNSTYADALSWDLTPEIRTLLEKNYADEKRHLEYINNVLATKAWEK